MPICKSEVTRQEYLDVEMYSLKQQLKLEKKKKVFHGPQILPTAILRTGI